ncbi:hypothetical protein GCK72_006611 [Caenorhabditis remanei]|uniref:Uncharacterized protein n=1 Tax=Caenorhabditis remanei TaxID=31234 RepID=A0A6A5HJU0_CAERE|nr:hypothetical protein GCK72_006611 [Caenorhabditis remanei]KAF1766653.1 hypothetical protein GCK72_006611 [Caenorhabditis remanei]
MTWKNCTICDGAIENDRQDDATNSPQKTVNYHEASATRQFRIAIITNCQEVLENNENNESEGNLENRLTRTVNFYVDMSELVIICPFFERFKELNCLDITTNCTDSWISAPPSVAASREDCYHDYKAPVNAHHFHAFLESACPSLYGIRPAPITLDSIIPVLDMLSHFHSEPLLTNCERFLMSTNIGQLDGSMLVRLLDKGLCVSLDHRILGRIICVCLLNTATKMSDVSQDLIGTVGSVFAQAFIANATKSFRHVKPLEQENALWPAAFRHLMIPTAPAVASTVESTSSDDKKKYKKGPRKHECDHTEESFECILCFDQRCMKCKGEAAFCYKALDNFLYEVRLQLYPHTYRPHLDRDLLREDRLSDYILRHQFQPIAED